MGRDSRISRAHGWIFRNGESAPVSDSVLEKNSLNCVVFPQVRWISPPIRVHLAQRLPLASDFEKASPKVTFLKVHAGCVYSLISAPRLGRGLVSIIALQTRVQGVFPRSAQDRRKRPYQSGNYVPEHSYTYNCTQYVSPSCSGSDIWRH